MKFILPHLRGVRLMWALTLNQNLGIPNDHDRHGARVYAAKVHISLEIVPCSPSSEIERKAKLLSEKNCPIYRRIPVHVAHEDRGVTNQTSWGLMTLQIVKRFFQI